LPVFFFTKNITCEDNKSAECSSSICKKLQKAYPKLKEHKNYHVSILHEKNNHIIFFCLYEEDGKALCCTSNSEIKQDNKKYIAEFNCIHNKKSTRKGINKIHNHSEDNPKVEKYKGDIPTLTQVQKVCD
tara:strand:- start:53 stop:442 length:390 start_codon:yes stop_codon:yes gene_type:complete